MCHFCTFKYLAISRLSSIHGLISWKSVNTVNSVAQYQTLLCLFEHHEHSITGPNNGVGEFVWPTYERRRQQWQWFNIFTFLQIVLQNLAIFNKSQQMLCYGYYHTQKIQSNIYIIILKMPHKAIHLKQDIYPIIPRIRFHPNRLHVFTLHDHRTQTMRATYGNMHDKQENMICLCKCN